MYESLTRLDNMFLFIRFVLSLLYHKNSTISEYDDLIGYAGKYRNHSVAWYINIHEQWNHYNSWGKFSWKIKTLLLHRTILWVTTLSLFHYMHWLRKLRTLDYEFVDKSMGNVIHRLSYCPLIMQSINLIFQYFLGGRNRGMRLVNEFVEQTHILK